MARRLEDLPASTSSKKNKGMGLKGKRGGEFSLLAISGVGGL